MRWIRVCLLSTSRIMQGRRFLTTQWLCDVLTIHDRFDEALQISQQSILTAQREHQAWALNIFETGRGRQLLQMGRLADAAAALGERFSQGNAEEVVDFLDAAGVVALGNVGIHTGERNLTRRAAEISSLMLDGAHRACGAMRCGSLHCNRWRMVIRKNRTSG